MMFLSSRSSCLSLSHVAGQTTMMAPASALNQRCCLTTRMWAEPSMLAAMNRQSGGRILIAVHSSPGSMEGLCTHLDCLGVLLTSCFCCCFLSDCKGVLQPDTSPRTGACQKCAAIESLRSFRERLLRTARRALEGIIRGSRNPQQAGGWRHMTVSELVSYGMKLTDDFRALSHSCAVMTLRMKLEEQR
jgi:hypothetical protein